MTARSAFSQSPATLPDLTRGPILLYDGSCGVCARSVQWILHHERSHVLRFAALNSPAGQALRAASHVGDDVDSLVWVEALSDGTVHARVWSDAVLAVISYVGGPWRGLGVLFVLPRGLRDAAYRLFARYRLKLAARSCLVPSFEERSRFLGA